MENNLSIVPVRNVTWVPVTAAWRVVILRMEETASRYGGKLRIYWISSDGQPTRVGPSIWVLYEGLTTPRRKKKENITKCYTGPRNCAGSCDHDNEPSASIKSG